MYCICIQYSPLIIIIVVFGIDLFTSHWFSVRLNNICKNGKYQMTFSMIIMMIYAEAEILPKLI